MKNSKQWIGKDFWDGKRRKKRIGGRKRNSKIKTPRNGEERIQKTAKEERKG